MYDGLNRHEWLGRSVMMAHLANINRGEKQKPFKPGDFNIYDSRGRLRKPRQAPKTPLSKVLEAAGIKKKGGHDGSGAHNDKDPRP